MGFINLLNVDTVDYRLSECLILNNHQISFPIDYHSMYFFSYYGSQWGMRSV